MYREILKTILTSLENPLSASFTYDDVSAWPESAVAVLQSSGILRRCENAQTVACDGCDQGCVEEVEFVHDGGVGLAAYVICRERDDTGRVRVAPERLHTWEVSIAALAEKIASELGTRCEEAITGRLWTVGSVDAGGQRTCVLLARGISWMDGGPVFKEALCRKRSQPAVLLVPARVPPADSFEVVPLEEVLCLDEHGLRVDVLAVRQAAERAQKASGGTPHVHKYLFQAGVDTWTIIYDGVAVSPPLRNTKGLHYLAFLLEHPGEEFYALQIVQEVDRTPACPDETYSAMSAEELEEHGLSVSGFTDTGEIMDATYEADVRRLMNELEEKRDLAEVMGDRQAAGKAEAELQQYCRALSEGIGLSGRHRSSGGASERARVAVAQAIGRVLKKLEKQHAALYEHLSASLRTGTKCAYSPTISINWKL